MKIGTFFMGSRRILVSVGGIIVLSAVAYGAFYSYSLHRELRNAKEELAARSSAFEASTKNLQQKLSDAQQENESITAVLSEQQKKNLELEKIKQKNERQLTTLKKLASTDPELLKKYSKVYFLSENYVPEDLESIDPQYLIDPSRNLKILAQVEPYLSDMLDAAARGDADLRVLSAYRSFEEQKNLKSSYVVQYGSGANKFSAEQGYSEHQLGTTVDFTTPTIRGAYLSFESSNAFMWLKNHAHQYGFVLSYPKGNQYYIYEPWHWRFVGTDLAQRLHDDNKYFYEMDQRDIDAYLVGIFD